MPDATGLELLAQDVRDAVPDSVLDTVFFRDRGTETVETFEVLREDVRFMLPKVIRQQLAARS